MYDWWSDVNGDTGRVMNNLRELGFAIVPIEADGPMLSRGTEAMYLLAGGGIPLTLRDIAAAVYAAMVVDEITPPTSPR